MGGYGSTRWGMISKKCQVEETLKLTLKPFKLFWQPGMRGTITWSTNGQPIADISFIVLGNDTPAAVRLIYTQGAKRGQPVDLDYPVQLTTTRLYRGGLRYWFTCPLCGYRAGCLYCAPGGRHFACRHCYRLSYASRQEGYKDLAMFARLAEAMQDKYPGTTGRDVKRVLRM